MVKEKRKSQHRLGKKMRKFLLILGLIMGVLVLGFFVLYFQMESEIHPSNFSKFRPSVHYLSSNPAYGETVTQPGLISVHFDYPLTKLTTISITAGDWEDSIGKNIYSSDGKTVSKQLKPTARNAIYTVNYTACFIDNYCDYGYFQFRLQTVH